MSREHVRALVASSLSAGDAVGWLEALYASADFDPTRIPWADLHPNPHLLDWMEAEGLRGDGEPALVVGCGLGDDAIALEAAGFAVTAFDVAPTAVAWSRQRFPDARVDWQEANLLEPPAAWHGRFAFIFEAYTLQVMPLDVRQRAMVALARCLAPGGRLLLVCRGRDECDAIGDVPWPLCRAELDTFEREGLWFEGLEDAIDPYEDSPVRRFVASWCCRV